MLKNTIIIINFFKHISLIVSNNIKEFYYKKVNKIIIDFLFTHVNNFIFYKINNSQFKTVFIEILHNDFCLYFNITFKFKMKSHLK